MAKMKKNIEGAKEALDELLFSSRDFTDEVQKAAKAFYGIGVQAREAKKVYNDISSSIRDINASLDDVINGTATISDLNKQALKLQDKRNQLQTNFRQSLGSIKLSEEDIQKIQQGKLHILDAISDQSDKLREGQLELLQTYGNQFKVISDTEDEIAIISAHAKKIQKNMGLTGTAFSSVEGIMKKMGAGDLADKLGFDEAIKGGREYSAQLETGQKKAGKLGKKFSVAGNMVKSLGKNLIKSLGPVGLLVSLVSMIVGSFKKLDKLSGDLAKNLGVSYDESKDLVMEMNKYSETTATSNVTTAQLVESQTKLNGLLGTNVKFSGKMAEEFALVQERMQLSDEAMAVFQKGAIKSGKTLKQQLQIVSDTTMELNAQTGLNLSNKEVMEGVAKASGRMVLSTKEGVKGLTKSLFAAKQMGLEFSQIEGMMDSMLDFESSIASEMEAELLTGKNLNLEKARQAALMNDTETFAKEITKQVGTAAEFGKMNRIQQEAIAKSVGMSANDLAESLKTQETQNKLKEAGFDSVSKAQEAYNELIEEGMSHEEAQAAMKAKGIDDALTAQMESQSKADKMAKIQEKLGDMFMKIADALMPLVEMIMSLFEAIMPAIQSLTEALAPIFKILVKTLQPVLFILGLAIDLVTTILTPAFKAIEEVMDSIFGIFEGIGKVAAGIFSGDTGLIMEGLKMIGGSLLKILLFPFQLLVDLFVGIVNFIIDGVNAILEYVPGTDYLDYWESPNLAGELGGAIGLAEGGIVTEPTNALIGEGGEPEAVVPLSKSENMGFGGKETNQLLKRILTTLEKGGTVELNGQKVGEAMALTNYSTQ